MFEGILHRKTPFVVAGPCSAESYEQLLAVTASLAKMSKVSLVRCGVWKPRTRPGGFEGAGVSALEWIARIRREMGPGALPFAVEVASPQHVELALRYGMEALWIGARTSGNPFSMAEIAESLRGTGIPVMVKNPLVPDAKLWMGAFERLAQVGIDDVVAVHRGFVTNNLSELRNEPLWQIPIELRRAMPSLPLLCDPSHLGGSARLIHSLSQTALNLDFDGLMVECHCSPSEALTDACQQVTPDELSRILDALTTLNHDDYLSADLRIYRERIASIDRELIALLSARLEVSERIAEVKQSANMPIYQPRQWDAKLQECISVATQQGMNPEFVRDLYERIHMESIRVQEQRQSQRHIAQKDASQEK